MAIVMECRLRKVRLTATGLSFIIISGTGNGCIFHQKLSQNESMEGNKNGRYYKEHNDRRGAQN